MRKLFAAVMLVASTATGAAGYDDIRGYLVREFRREPEAVQYGITVGAGAIVSPLLDCPEGWTVQEIQAYLNGPANGSEPLGVAIGNYLWSQKKCRWLKFVK